MTMTDKRYTFATGRRKCAIARVQLHEGTGQVIVNGRPLAECLPRLTDQDAIFEPFRATNTAGRYSVMAKITGGGTSGWAGGV